MGQQRSPPVWICCTDSIWKMTSSCFAAKERAWKSCRVGHAESSGLSMQGHQGCCHHFAAPHLCQGNPRVATGLGQMRLLVRCTILEGPSVFLVLRMRCCSFSMLGCNCGAQDMQSVVLCACIIGFGSNKTAPAKCMLKYEKLNVGLQDLADIRTWG